MLTFISPTLKRTARLGPNRTYARIRAASAASPAFTTLSDIAKASIPTVHSLTPSVKAFLQLSRERSTGYRNAPSRGVLYDPSVAKINWDCFTRPITPSHQLDLRLHTTKGHTVSLSIVFISNQQTSKMQRRRYGGMLFWSVLEDRGPILRIGMDTGYRLQDSRHPSPPIQQSHISTHPLLASFLPFDSIMNPITVHPVPLYRIYTQSLDRLIHPAKLFLFPV